MPNDDPEIPAVPAEEAAFYISTMPAETEGKMPHPTLTKISGKPNRTSIQTLRAELLENACSVHSDGGDGLLGHARIVLTEEEYNKNSYGAEPFLIPTKPATLNHDPTLTHKTMYVLDKAFAVELTAWKTYQSTASTLKGQLLVVIRRDTK